MLTIAQAPDIARRLNARVHQVAATASSSALRAWIQLLRPAPATNRDATARLPAVLAYTVVLGLWAIFFGTGIVNAVRVMVGDYVPATDPATLGDSFTRHHDV